MVNCECGMRGEGHVSRTFKMYCGLLVSPAPDGVPLDRTRVGQNFELTDEKF